MDGSNPTISNKAFLYHLQLQAMQDSSPVHGSEQNKGASDPLFGNSPITVVFLSLQKSLLLLQPLELNLQRLFIYFIKQLRAYKYAILSTTSTSLEYI